MRQQAINDIGRRRRAHGPRWKREAGRMLESLGQHRLRWTRGYVEFVVSHRPSLSIWANTFLSYCPGAVRWHIWHTQANGWHKSCARGRCLTTTRGRSSSTGLLLCIRRLRKWLSTLSDYLCKLLLKVWWQRYRKRISMAWEMLRVRL